MKKHFLSSTITKAVGADGTTSYRFIASTNSKDRHGEAILQSGWELDNYLKNAQVLYGHDSWSFPIGKTVKLELTDNALIADIVFASKEANEKAEQVRLLVEEGILSAVSVGFIPKDIQDIDGVRTITQAELLEISIVPIPANQDAVRIAKSKGLSLEGLLEKDVEGDEVIDTSGMTAELNDNGTATIRDENGDVVDENVPVVSRDDLVAELGEDAVTAIENDALSTDDDKKSLDADAESDAETSTDESTEKDADTSDDDGLIEVEVEVEDEKNFDDDDDIVAIVEVDDDGFVKITDIDDYIDNDDEKPDSSDKDDDEGKADEDDADELDVDPELSGADDEKTANRDIMETKAGRRLSDATINSISTAKGHAEKMTEHLTAFISTLDELVLGEAGDKTVGDYVLISKNDLKALRDMMRDSDKSVGNALSFLKNI